MRYSSLACAFFLSAVLWSAGAYAQTPVPTAEQQQLRKIYQELVEINTTQ